MYESGVGSWYGTFQPADDRVRPTSFPNLHTVLTIVEVWATISSETGNHGRQGDRP